MSRKAAGKAWIDDVNTKVIEVALDRSGHGWGPEENHFQHQGAHACRPIPCAAGRRGYGPPRGWLRSLFHPVANVFAGAAHSARGIGG
jgi:hypothetical protein